MATIQLKTKRTQTSPAAVIAAIASDQQRADARTLVALMRTVSGKRPVMWGSSLIGFGEVPYRRSNGDTGEWLKIGFAVRKGALSLYLTCDIGEYAGYLEKLGPHKRGVGCLYIKRLSDINKSVLTSLIRAAYKAKPVWMG